MTVMVKSNTLGRKTKRIRGKDSVHKRHCFKSSPLLSMGDVFKDEADPAWKIVIAREPLWFYISTDHIKIAKRGDARYCVVALALDGVTGGMYDYQIGAGITKIFDIKRKIEVRFKTPGVLQRAMRNFDPPMNGKWNLPPGLYRLHPMPKSWRDQTGTKGKKLRKKRRDAAKGVSIAVSTRRKPAKRAPVTRFVLRHGGIKRLAELAAESQS